MLQLGDTIGVVHVEFAAPPPLVLPAHFEFTVKIRIGLVREGVAVSRFARDDIQTDAADTRWPPSSLVVILSDSSPEESASRFPR